MTEMYVLYVILAILLATLAGVNLIPKFKFRSIVTVLLFLSSLVAFHMAYEVLPSRPRPVDLMTWDKPNVDEAVVLADLMEEGVAIYMLLYAPELGPVPRYYKFPWSQRAAEKLQEAKRKAKARGMQGGDDSVTMTLPFEQSLEDRKDDIFRDPPQPIMMPPKPPEDESDVIQHRRSET